MILVSLVNETFWKVVCAGLPVASRRRSSHRISLGFLLLVQVVWKDIPSNVGESGVISIVGGIVSVISFRSDIIV